MNSQRVILIRNIPTGAVDELRSAAERSGFPFRFHHPAADTPAATDASVRSWDGILLGIDGRSGAPWSDLEEQRSAAPDAPVICMALDRSSVSMDEAMRNGAADCIDIGHTGRLLTALDREIRHYDLRRAHRHSQTQLRLTEQRLRLLADHAPDLIYRYRLTEPAGFEYVSPSATAMTGYTPEDHYADPLLGVTLVHPDDRHLLDEIVCGTAEAERPLELRWRRRDGSVLWTEQRNVIIRDDTGEPVAIEGIARDISERKSEEESRRRHTRLLEQAESTAGLGCWEFDRTTGRIWWSAQMYRMFGAAPSGEAPSFDAFLRIVHPADRDAVSGGLRALEEGRVPKLREYRTMTIGGAPRQFHPTIEADRAADGTVLRFYGTVLEVTELRAAERRNATLNRLYSLLSGVNRTIVRARDPHGLLNDLCRLAVTEGSYTHACAYALDPERGTLTRTASAGAGTDRSEFDTADPSFAGCPVVTALRTGQPSAANMFSGHAMDCPVCGISDARGIRAVAVHPVTVSGRTAGVFIVGSADAGSFDARETALLAEIAGDISYALEFHGHERARRESEEALRTNESRYRMMFEANPLPMWVYDRASLRFLTVNDAAVRTYGYSRDEFLGMTILDIRPEWEIGRLVDDLGMDREEYAWSGLWTHRHRSGAEITAEVSSHTFDMDGVPACLVLAVDVTGREIAFRRLLESEQRWKSLAESAPTGIAIGRDRSFHYVNPHFARLLGYESPADVTGRPVERLFEEADRADVAERLFRPRHAGAGTAEEFLLSGLRRDGRRVDLQAAVTRISLADGEATLGFFTDITERKRFEGRLVQSERKFRSLFEDHAAAQLLVDPASLAIVDANAAAEQFYGWPAGGLCARTLFDITVDPGERLREDFERIRSGERVRSEFHQRRADGIERTVEVFGSLIDADGASFFHAIVHDLTDKVESLRQLRLNTHALNAAQNAVVITDRSGSILWVNRAMTEMTGYSFDEAVGRNPRDLIRSGRHDAPFYADLWNTILRGEVWNGELYNRRKDGTVYREEQSITPVRDEQGVITHFIAVKQDVTVQREMQEQINQSQKVESLGTLAGGIAHDFNNILGIILAYTEMIGRRNMDEEKFHHAVTAINKALQRGMGLVKQIMTFARKSETVFAAVRIEAIVAELAAMVAETFPRTIVMTAEHADDLPAVSGDQSQLHQVLLNLCVNARDAMPDGGTITVRTVPSSLDEVRQLHPDAGAERYVRVTVTDTGEGMGAETLKRIFDPFYTTKEKGKGTGLGLSVVHGIVKIHHGYITVTSVPGTGTTFTLLLPTHRPQPGGAATAA